MILYFSATGNCKHVAKRIAKATGDKAVSIEGLDPHITLADGEALGFVSPTYAWELPTPVSAFLGRLDAEAPCKPYAFFVATYYTTPGRTYPVAQKMVRGRPFAPFDAEFSVRMPDTWTPIFDLSDPERVAETVTDAEPLIDDVIGKVVARESGDWCGPRTPRIAAPAMHLHHLSMRRTSHFSVDETCIGCGLCAKRCPAQAIEMRNGMPTWAKESCFACLRCLHSCPKFAIQYGRNTRTHGQYRHP